jgi:hypothetical protein
LLLLLLGEASAGLARLDLLPQRPRATSSVAAAADCLELALLQLLLLLLVKARAELARLCVLQ